MTKAELIDLVAQNTGESRAGASRMVEAVLRSIVDGVQQHEKITIPRFGTFRKKVRKPRVGVNPLTKAKVEIRGCTTIGFTPSSTLKSQT